MSGMQEDAPDSPPNPEQTPATGLACPHCGGMIDAGVPGGSIIQCPHCNTQFFAPQPDIEEESDVQEPTEENAHTEAELSELRIRQFSTLRRAAYRTRSYFIVGTLGCLGLAIQLIISAVESARFHHQWGRGSISDLLFAAAAFIGVFFFGRHALEVQRGINASLREREREEAEAARNEPDFSLLSDGSQHAQNLHRMFEQGGGRSGNEL